MSPPPSEEVEPALPPEDERYRLLVDGVRDYAICMLDTSGLVATWNAAAERIIGYTPDEIIGRHVSVLYTAGEVLAGRPERDLLAAEDEGHLETEGWRVRKDGSRFWANVIITALIDHDGRMRGFSNVARDISERKRLEERLRLPIRAGAILAESLDYDTTLQQVANLVVPSLGDWCVVDVIEDGHVRRVAVAHADPGKVALAKRFEKRYPPDPNPDRGVGKVIRTGRPELVPVVSDELLARSARDPEHLELLRSLRPTSYLSVPLISRGRTLGAMSLVWAESGHRYTEGDIELALEVARRAALAIDHARLYRDATEAIRVRDEFLSIASHELKTPLTPLQLQLENIRRTLERKGPLDEKVDRRLLTATRQTRRLQHLVESLLDVSRISAGRLTLEIEDTDLVELTREVIDRFRDSARGAGSTLDVHAPEHLAGRWDPLRIEQVVVNVMSNAIKYGAGKPIVVTVEEVGETARIAVADHGIGIAEEQAGRIFERFERAASSRHYGGLGLGLFIAHQIVQAHGGSILVASTPGVGSTFTVVLPREPRRGADASTSSKPEWNAGREPEAKR